MYYVVVTIFGGWGLESKPVFVIHADRKISYHLQLVRIANPARVICIARQYLEKYQSSTTLASTPNRKPGAGVVNFGG